VSAAGLFLVSLVVLGLQILHTRIFSFTLWHHLAYMVISIALMGMGAAGTWLATRRREPAQPSVALASHAALLGIFSIVSLALATRIPLDTYMSDRLLQLAYVFLYYLALIFPYFFAGVVVALLFRTKRERINVLYLVNLAGSAIGGFAAIFLLEQFGGEGATLLLSAAATAAAFCFSASGDHRKARLITGCLTLCIIALYPARSALFPITAPPSKAIGMGRAYDPDQAIEYTAWDRVARIDVFSNKRSQEFFNYFPELKNKVITIDGDAYTLLYDFPSVSTPGTFDYPAIGRSLYSVAYLVHERPTVLIVGLGGGTDVVTALHNDASSVVGVEINKAMIEVTRDRYADYIARPYQDPRVTVVHSEGRSYIRRSSDRYDIIQMSGVDTWTALASGAYVLSESYLYTTDAIREYLEHLTPDGTLSIIRWLFWPPRETLRLCTEMVSVLRAMGASDPARHIVIIGDGHLGAVLVKRRPFTWHEIATLAERVRESERTRILYAPGFEVDDPYWEPVFRGYPFSFTQGASYIRNSFHAYFSAAADGTDASFISRYDYDITPVSDDKPFFFHYYRFRHLFTGEWGGGGSPVDKMPVALTILILSLVQSLLFSFLLVVAPLFLMRKEERLFSPHLQVIYFSMLGIGFMFIELSLIQRFVLFLGNPSEAIAAIIMLLLSFAGIGALFSKKFQIRFGDRRLFKGLAAVMPLLVLGYAAALPPLTAHFLSASFALRIAISALLLAPLGFGMGIFFPSGLTIVGEKNPGFIPWACAINSVAGVVSSILAILLAMAYGFTFVLTAAAFCYLLAAISFHRFAKKHP